MRLRCSYRATIFTSGHSRSRILLFNFSRLRFDRFVITGSRCGIEASLLSYIIITLIFVPYTIIIYHNIHIIITITWWFLSHSDGEGNLCL